MYNDQYFLRPIAVKPLVYPGNILFKQFFDDFGTLAFRSFDLDRDETDDPRLGQPRLCATLLAARRRPPPGPRHVLCDPAVGRGPRLSAFSTAFRSANSTCTACWRTRSRSSSLRRGRRTAAFTYSWPQTRNRCRAYQLRSPGRCFEYYFSFPEAERMYAEPDITNPRSNRILQQVGFQFIESIKMSYKTANLYVLTRDRFKHSNHSNH